jgi:cysteine desulfurase
MIYLDYNATTPVDDRVLAEMTPFFSGTFANAASSHDMGRAASEAVEAARSTIAELIGVQRGELYFTSGATEANNLAIRGFLRTALKSRPRLLVGATEHRAVLDTAHDLRDVGVRVDEVPVGTDGLIDEEAYVRMLDERVGLVSIMWANNETGVIAAIARLAELAHSAGALFHTDATQAIGKVPIDLKMADVDLASLSAHKVYGPKGVGALFASRGVNLETQMSGGGQEHGLRSGTLNVPGIVGFGAAAALARDCLTSDRSRLADLSAHLVVALRARINDVRVIAEDSPRLPNTVNICMVGADSEAVMANAPGVALSSGSACTALVPEVSHVLLAMGLRSDQAEECLRFSLGRPTTIEEIDAAVTHVAEAVRRVRLLTA